MRLKVLYVLVAIMAIGISVYANGDDWAARKAAMARGGVSDSKAIMSTHNDTIAVQLESSDGQFNIGKFNGSVTLTYNYPVAPWSSWTCFVIDGIHYTDDFAGTSTPPIEPSGSVPIGGGGGAVAFPFTLHPHSGDSSYILGGWRQSGLNITQMLQPTYVIHDDLKDAFIFIKYEIVNTDSTPHTVGVILQLDTMIDGNDAAELGTIWGYSGIEEDWAADSMPPWWFAYEAGPPPPSGAITAMGILDGFDAVRPDRFAVGGWWTFNSVGTWTYSVSGTPYTDSAVLYWWGIDTLAPGDTMIAATYYGIGHPYITGSFSYIVDDVDVENCVYTPNPFNFFVMFTNESGTSLDSAVVHLVLPPGLSPVTGSIDTLMSGGAHLTTGGSGVMSWDIDITSPPAWDSIQVYVTSTSTSDTFWPEEAYRLTLPFVGAPPQGAPITPTDGAWTTCADQGIVLQFESENGLDLPTDMTFVIDGAVLDLTSPLLTLDDDTLTFMPAIDLTDGAMVDWGLVAATDAMGCSLVAPVFGTFYVDLTPPVAENEWPEDASILGSSDIPETWVELYDVLREVDPASIVLNCMGTAYSISDPELSYANDTLTFSLEDAGIVLEDGDSICFEIEEAKDIEPDYCIANVMDEYEWCFSINVIDLWMPDTNLCPPGDTFDIPIFCEDLAGLSVTELDITVDFLGRVLEPLGIELAGAVASSWTLSVATTANSMNITGTGPELGSGDVLFYLKFFVPPGSSEGSYSPLNFSDVIFNSGALASKPVDGFATICFTTHMWSNDIVFSLGEQKRRILTFGVTGSATDAFDPGLDIESLPTPATHLEGYFDLDDPTHPLITELERDMRGPAPLPIVWTGFAGYPSVGVVSVRWNSGHFPEGRVYMTYFDGGIERTVNMKRVDHVSFTNETDFTIVFDQPELGRADLIVCPGWNLVSFPFVPNEAVTISDAIPTSITDGYWYNPETHSYEVAMFPEPSKGYWVFCTAGDTTVVGGMLVDETQLDILAGWNLFGIPWKSTGTIPLSALTSTPDVVVPTNIYGHDGCGTGAYFTPTDLVVGDGYWLLSTGIALMTIEGDSTASKALPIYEPECLFEMTIDGDPYAIGLDERASVGIDPFDRAIPPLDPDGGTMFGGICSEYFLARDIRPGDDGKTEFEIDAAGRRLSWDSEAIPDGYELDLVNGAINIDMAFCGEAILAENAKIVVRCVLPTQPTLYSAVPNPFNPVTQIRFAIPTASEAELAIYDLLGKRISTIAKGDFEAGMHTFEWHGIDDAGIEMPSGVYFYRLSVETGESLTKSMVLLR